MPQSQILVVEDETIIAMDIQSRLRHLGFDAEIATSGEEAVSKAINEPPDLILMDIVLPGTIDGIEAAEEIRKRFDIPVIYLTAYSDSRTLERAKQTGPYGYLLKPLKDRDLFATIEMATYKHKMERQLREGEERYRLLFESVPHPMWVYDTETLGFLAVNDAAVQHYGYSREEFLEMNIADIRPPEELPALIQALAHLTKEIERSGIFKHKKKDGSVFSVEIVSHGIEFVGRTAEIVLATDITERLQSEEQRARRLNQTALRADVSVALSEPEGSLRKIIQICVESVTRNLSAALARIWTLNQKDNVLELQASAGLYTHINGAHSHVPVGDLKIGRIAQNKAPHLTNDVMNDPEISDKNWARENGIVAFAGYPLMVEDRLVGVLAMFSHRPLEPDTLEILESVAEIISQAIERKRTEAALRNTEEQLRQSQRLEAIGQLAGGVAHDFNNLLTAIIGYSDISMGRLMTEDPLYGTLNEIKKAGERAANLTRQLLAFSRKQVLMPRVLDLNRIVMDMSKMLHRLLGEDIELKPILEMKLGSVKADPGQIEQVIMNLAINARDAMPEGGRLTVETSNVFLENEYASLHIGVNPGPYVLIAISDNGSGMNEETKSHIFEPFFTTKEPGKGTGLGLSTVYGIVKQSGGSIWVYSEPDKGTTFKVYLPRVDQTAEEIKRTTSTSELPRGTETILLAEDEEVVRNLVRSVLEKLGYTILEAANGGAGLLICERHPGTIHLLLTDVVMPEMSGRELADRLNNVRPEMKILYMSGYTEKAINHHGVLDEKVNFIHKPFSPAALAMKVREVLDKKSDESIN